VRGVWKRGKGGNREKSPREEIPANKTLVSGGNSHELKGSEHKPVIAKSKTFILCSKREGKRE